ncbi:SHOCT domain-containing protein [Halorarius halobius]|uniref:SHOCT domain-containing protein n=1 Tax=Halorarius halobius TaxID=2962671 RepID=UPI0020CD95CD|nr:SHOCT domain-containing protein [Halorarius halobius]
MRPHRHRGDADPRVGAVAGVVSAGVLAVAFGLLALGVPWFWVAFPVGYGGVLPLAVGIAKRRTAEEHRDPDDGDDDPVTAAKRAYARGDIDEMELERRLDRLLDDDATDLRGA